MQGKRYYLKKYDIPKQNRFLKDVCRTKTREDTGWRIKVKGNEDLSCEQMN